MFDSRIETIGLDQISPSHNFIGDQQLSIHCNSVANLMHKMLILKRGEFVTSEEEHIWFLTGYLHDYGRNFSTNSFEPYEHALIGSTGLSLLSGSNDHVIQRAIRDHGDSHKLEYAIRSMDRIHAKELNIPNQINDPYDLRDYDELVKDRQYFELLIDLDRADMLVTKAGKIVSYYDRLNEISSRYGANSDEFKDCDISVSMILRYDERWAFANGCCKFYSTPENYSISQAQSSEIQSLKDEIQPVKSQVDFLTRREQALTSHVNSLNQKYQSLKSQMKAFKE